MTAQAEIDIFQSKRVRFFRDEMRQKKPFLSAQNRILHAEARKIFSTRRRKIAAASPPSRLAIHKKSENEGREI